MDEAKIYAAYEVTGKSQTLGLLKGAVILMVLVVGIIIGMIVQARACDKPKECWAISGETMFPKKVPCP